jgi:hypothetical protein
MKFSGVIKKLHQKQNKNLLKTEKTARTPSKDVFNFLASYGPLICLFVPAVSIF